MNSDPIVRCAHRLAQIRIGAARDHQFEPRGRQPAVGNLPQQIDRHGPPIVLIGQPADLLLRLAEHQLEKVLDRAGEQFLFLGKMVELRTAGKAGALRDFGGCRVRVAAFDQARNRRVEQAAPRFRGFLVLRQPRPETASGWWKGAHSGDNRSRPGIAIKEARSGSNGS